jgi:hypothetical protein
MFPWYRNAVKCYVFLSDVSAPTLDNEGSNRVWESAFRRSRWFTRGWTLQELIAPTSVEFFSKEEAHLGGKNTLERQIHSITEIPPAALRSTPLSHFSIEERLKWAATRNTKGKRIRRIASWGFLTSPCHSYTVKKITRSLGLEWRWRKVHSVSSPLITSVFCIAKGITIAVFWTALSTPMLIRR